MFPQGLVVAALLVKEQLEAVGLLLHPAKLLFQGGDFQPRGLVTVSGVGDVAFLGSQINSSGVTISGSGDVNAASTLNLGGGNLTLSGSGATTLSGTQINVGTIAVTGTGTQEFETQINANALTISGSGTTTLGGTGNNNINTTNITGGTLILDKDSGTALTGTVTVGDGGTLDFGGDNQTTAWTNLTLGEGSTLLLGNTDQTLANLTITGDTIIDFAGGGSSLSVGNLTLAEDATLTIINWSNAVDYFTANVDPGSPVLGDIVIDGNPGASWDPYDGTITPAAPVPEPSTYGAILVGASAAWLWWRRRRRPMPGGSSKPSLA